VIARAQASGRRLDFEQYRVFCLVALGRTAEAERAIASVVQADPSFVPDTREVSPRIRDMFAKTRRALVPEIAHRLYSEGRESLNRHDKATAQARFESVVRLIDSATDDKTEQDDEAEEPLLSELRLLASGFLDLSRATEARADARPAPRQPAAASSAPSVDITAPTPIKQDLPPWNPTDPMMRREFRGALRVFISEAGRVTGAELAPSIHPVYDRQLLAAAKTWHYEPALRNGLPVASEKLLEVVLKPR
jgi:TonB family protein